MLLLALWLERSAAHRAVEWPGNYGDFPLFQRKYLSNRIVICSKISSELKRERRLLAVSFLLSTTKEQINRA